MGFSQNGFWIADVLQNPHSVGAIETRVRPGQSSGIAHAEFDIQPQRAQVFAGVFDLPRFDVDSSEMQVRTSFANFSRARLPAADL